jgi:signal transduction histidine kinase
MGEGTGAELFDVLASTGERDGTEADGARALRALVAALTRQVSEALIERSTAIAALAHELSSPLWSIQLIADRLRADPETAEVERLVERIHRNVGHAARLVEAVCRLFEIEDGSRGLEIGEHQLGELVTDLVSELEPSATRARVGLAVRADGRPDRFCGDATWITAAIENLIANAIRHSPPDSEVAIIVEGGDRAIRCAVADRGPGIPSELRDAVFSRHTSFGANRGAAGLGLFIARRVVTAHGGRIWIADPGPAAAGSRFVIELPVVGPAALQGRFF